MLEMKPSTYWAIIIAMFGLAIAFWGTIGWVAYHFITKFW